MSKYVLGLDISPESITMVQLSGTSKTYTLTAAVQQSLPPSTDPEEQAEAQRQALRELVQGRYLRADTVVTTIPAHRAMLRNLTVPFKDTRRIHQVLKGTLEDHIPLEPEDVIADFQVLPFQHSGETPLLIAAVPRQVVAEHLSIVHAGNLEPTVIDLDAFAVANAAVLGATQTDSNAVLVDLNATHTLITLLHQGVPVFTRSTAHGLPLADMPLDTLAGRLGKQLQHTLYACEHALQRSYDPQLLLLSGSWGNQLAHLAEALHDSLGIPASVWHLTSTAYKPEKVQLAAADQAPYAVAFGAALRGLRRQAAGVNLRRDSFALHRNLQEVRGRLIGLGIMLFGVAGLALASLYVDGSIKMQRHVQLEQAITEVFRNTLPDNRIVQPTFQLQSKVRELEERLRAFGGVTGAQLSGLQILQEISARAPAAITVDIDTLTITTAATDLTGTTASYDNVVKLRDALEASPFFRSVKITNTHTKDNKVAFKLTITTAPAQDSTT